MHAQSHKREAFALAVEHFLEGGGYADRPSAISEAFGEEANIANAITALWASTDILPGTLADDVEDLLGVSLLRRTYGAAAQAIHSRHSDFATPAGEVVS